MPRISKYSATVLQPIVAGCNSIGQVLDAFKLKRTGGNYRMIRQRIAASGLDTSHFRGQGWARGLLQSTDARIERAARFKRLPDEEVFRRGSAYPTSKLAKRLTQIGWPYVCNRCEITTWLGEPITLHVDHINGDNSDHQFANLRFLCPNCHQQTKTWGMKRQ